MKWNKVIFGSLPILGKKGKIFFGMKKEELLEILEKSDILKKRRGLGNGYEWFDLWVNLFDDTFLISACFNPNQQLEIIELYPYLTKDKLSSEGEVSWEQATKSGLMEDKKICNNWLRKHRFSLHILNHATVFLDEKSFSAGIIIRKFKL